MKTLKCYLASAYKARTLIIIPYFKTIIGSGVLALLALVLIATVVVPPSRGADYHFVSEQGLITAVSCYLLSLSSAFSLGMAVLLLKNKQPDVLIWGLMMIGFAFLSIDETAQFHERLGGYISRFYDSGSFRNWNDVVVIVYGLIALPIGALLFPRLLRYRALLECFAIAFTFYVVHTLIDSTCEPETIVSVIVEESCKLYCGLFLALGTFLTFLGTVWQKPLSAPQLDVCDETTDTEDAGAFCRD